MASEVLPGARGEVRAASTAGTGSALTTSAVYIQFLPGTKFVWLYGRNYSTAVGINWIKCPYLAVVLTADSLATGTDVTGKVQDASTSTTLTLSSMDTAANGDYLYVGSEQQFRGVYVDVGSTNSNASVLTVNYWNGTAWTTTSATDNTASGGATIAVDGTVTWTLPTDWAQTTLVDAGDSPGTTFPYRTKRMYWTRWQVSAALDASVTVLSMTAMNRLATYATLPTSTVWDEKVQHGMGGWSGIEAATDAGTANIVVNCGATEGGALG